MDTVLVARPSIPGEGFSRVALTRPALDMIQRLWARNGPLMFHQSGGCCDGSAPMCFSEGEFITSDSADVRLGVFSIPAPARAGTENSLPDDAGLAGPKAGLLGELGFWMSLEQFEYWKHTRLTVDLVSGRGSGFSMEAPEGKRFLIRSELLEP